MITPDDRRVLDILAQNPDGATDRSLSTAGVSRDLLERLVYAGYLRQQQQLFARSGKAAAVRFYLTPAGRKARIGAPVRHEH